MNPTCKKCKRSNNSEFLTCQTCRDKSNQYKKENKEACKVLVKLWKQRNWDRRIVCHSRDSDRDSNRLPADMSTFVTPSYLRRLREAQQNECAYCAIYLQTRNRKEHDGLTLQRMNNTIGHTRANCILSCHSCNMHRVESMNEEFLAEKKARVYFDKLVRGGYSTLNVRCPSLH